MGCACRDPAADCVVESLKGAVLAKHMLRGRRSVGLIAACQSHIALLNSTAYHSVRGGAVGDRGTSMRMSMTAAVHRRMCGCSPALCQRMHNPVVNLAFSSFPWTLHLFSLGTEGGGEETAVAAEGELDTLTISRPFKLGWYWPGWARVEPRACRSGAEGVQCADYVVAVYTLPGSAQ